MQFPFVSDFHFSMPSAAAVKTYSLAVMALAVACGDVAAADNRVVDQLSTSSISRDWDSMKSTVGSQGTVEKVKRVNEFFNRKIEFTDDQTAWGKSDYWASPAEMMAKGKGDCEDFAIAKYFSLVDLGIPENQLRLIYVQNRVGGPSSEVKQAHMVLGFYPTPESDPLILDNLITDIREAKRRPDLEVVFSFNRKGIYPGASGSEQSYGGPERITAWQSLLRRNEVPEQAKQPKMMLGSM